MRISVPELDFRRRARALIDAGTVDINRLRCVALIDTVHTKNAGVVSPGSVAVPIIALGPLLLMASVITAPERFLALAPQVEAAEPNVPEETSPVSEGDGAVRGSVVATPVAAAVVTIVKQCK